MNISKQRAEDWIKRLQGGQRDLRTVEVKAEAFRTPRGNVTAKAREEFGDKENSYPINDAKSANSALKLRGHRKGKARANVLNRVESWARKNNNETILKKVQKARKEDKDAGLI